MRCLLVLFFYLCLICNAFAGLNPGYLLTNAPAHAVASNLSVNGYHVSSTGVVYVDIPFEHMINVSNQSQEEFFQGIENYVTAFGLSSGALSMVTPQTWLEKGLAAVQFATAQTQWGKPVLGTNSAAFDLGFNQWKEATSDYCDKGAVLAPEAIDGPGELTVQVLYKPGAEMRCGDSAALKLEVRGPNGLETYSLGHYWPAEYNLGASSPCDDDRIRSLGRDPMLSQGGPDGKNYGVAMLPEVRFDTPGSYELKLISSVSGSPADCGGEIATATITVGSQNFNAPPVKDIYIYTLGGGVYLASEAFGSNLKRAYWEVFRLESDAGTDYTPYEYNNYSNTLNEAKELISRDVPDGKYLLKGGAEYYDGKTFRFQYELTMCGGLPQWTWDYTCPGTQPPPAPSITILSPSNTFTTEQDAIINVNWSGANLAAGGVEVLLSGPSGSQVLDGSGAVSESVNYRIPAAATPGSYTIVVRSNADPNVSASSPSFTVAEKQEPCVGFCPQISGADQGVIPGHPYGVTWTHDYYDRFEVVIYLEQNGLVVYGLDTVWSSDGGYTFKPSMTWDKQGTGFSIVLHKKYGGDVLGRTDTFTILPEPTVTLTSPLNGATMTAGNTYEFEWHMVGNNGGEASIRMSPQSGESFKILDDGPNTGSFIWTVPADIADGTYDARLTTLAGLHSYAENLTIRNRRIITATAGPGGSISTPGSVDFGYGSSVDYSISSDANHVISDVVVDGVSMGPVASHTFQNVTEAHTIHALFEPVKRTLTVTVQGDGQGVVTCSSGMEVGDKVWQVPHGETVTLDAVPDDGNLFVKWIGGENPVGTSVDLTVEGDTTISVEFIRETDGDGIPDAYEIANGMDPNSALDRSGDQDHDGLPNWAEFRFGTQANNPFSRGAGIRDYWLVQSPVSAGYGTVAYVDPDGRLFMWGENYGGLTAAPMSPGFSNPVDKSHDMKWKAASVGGHAVIAIKEDGTLWSWGQNYNGQLGDGTMTDRPTPACIDTRTNWMSVHARDRYYFAINADGELWAWGKNDKGRLGLGDSAPDPVLQPTRVGDRTGWLKVASDTDFVVALNEAPGVFAWGDWSRHNAHIWQLVLQDPSTYTYSSAEPIQFGADKTYMDIDTRGYYSYNDFLVQEMSGDIQFWGWNEGFTQGPILHSSWTQDGFFYVKADGTLIKSEGTPNSAEQIGDVTNWAFVFASQVKDDSDSTAFAIDRDGKLFSFGAGWFGQLGDGKPMALSSPQRLSAQTDWAHASVSMGIVVATKDDGTLSYMVNSRDAFEQFGTNESMFTQVQSPEFWKTILPSPYQTSLGIVARDANAGALVKWMGDDFGNLQTMSTNTWAELFTAGSDVFGIDANKSLWKFKTYISDVESSGTLVAENVTSFTGAYSYKAYVKTDGNIWVEGYMNHYGPDGEPENIFKHLGTPAAFDSTGTWQRVAGGDDYLIALKDDGTLWGLGSNGHGQLGLGAPEYVTTLTQVGTDSDWAHVVCGKNYTLAVKQDGSLWGWGNNSSAQIGGSDAKVLAPVLIDAGPWSHNVSVDRTLPDSMSAVVAVKADGTLWAWGYWGGMTETPVPVAIESGPKDSDGDGIEDAQELQNGTNPYDADTDDDGIIDSAEDVNGNGIVDEGETDPLLADTDADGIQDGTESGLTSADIGPDTDPAVFVPDADSSTTTDPTRFDTNGDGVSDGDSDTNFNGRVDPGESDPNGKSQPVLLPALQLLLD